VKSQKIFLSALLIVLLSNVSAFGAEKFRLALDIGPDRRSGLTEQDARIITDVLFGKLSQAAHIEVYGRGAQLDAVRKELHFGGSAVVDPRTRPELGNFVVTQGILTASVSVINQEYSERESSLSLLHELIDRKPRRGGRHNGRRNDYHRSRRNDKEWRYTGEYSLRLLITEIETTRVVFAKTVQQSVSETYSKRSGFPGWEKFRTKAVTIAATQITESIRQWINRGGVGNTVNVVPSHPASGQRRLRLPSPRRYLRRFEGDNGCFYI
jgi:hypothetical protein